MRPRDAIALTILLLLGAGAFGQEPAPQPYDSGGPLPAEQAAYDVRFYDLSLRIDPDRRWIGGSLRVVADVTEPLDTLVLNLDPLLRVDSVWCVSAEGGTAGADFVQRGPYLRIALPGTARPGDRIDCTILYSGQPRKAVNPPWDGGLVWSRTPSGAHWVAVTCQMEGADIWWPCKDHPSDEPDSMALHFTVPGDLVCVANGRLLGEQRNPDGTRTFHWFVSTPINNYGVTFYAAPYVAIESTYVSVCGDTIPTTFWALPEHAEAARAFLPYVYRDLRFLEEVAGPYPFRADKYGVVEAPYLGMEHQTAIAYGSHFVPGPEGFDWLHAHELAHEWYGNCATVPDWKDFWIHEGFASYMEAFYAERLKGREAYVEYLTRFRRGIRNRLPVAPRETRTAGQAYNIDIYYKGAWILHTLRFLIGDEAFFEFLHRVVYPDVGLERVTDGRQCHFVTTEDVIALAESISGQSLQWFFELYLRQSQLPHLVVERRQDFLELRWVTPQDLLFPMPVEVQVGGRRYRVSMSGGTGSVQIRPGDSFSIDPDDWVLMDEPVLTAVDGRWALVPRRVELLQNWPNPFNEATLLRFILPRSERVRLEVFDLTGRCVATLLNETREAGTHAVQFRAEGLPSGMYVCRLQAGHSVRTRKIVLVR